MISNLQVEWVGDELRARWQGGEDPTVFVSGSPDDAGTVIVPVDTPGRLRVAGLPTGFRAYVHVLDLDGEWVVAGERLVRLSRTVNAVDLGGHRTADGRAVRWGRVYAGDPIDDLDPAGREALRGLRVRTIADLRGGFESPGRPAWLDPDVRWELPGLGTGSLLGDEDLVGPGEDAAGGSDDAAGASDDAAGGTDDAAGGTDDAAQLAEVAALVADPANHAVLVHAGVGQDRAVVVAALLLSAVGVDDADLPFFPTRAEVLADVRDRFGSVAGELTAGGLEVAAAAQLAEVLVGH